MKNDSTKKCKIALWRDLADQHIRFFDSHASNANGFPDPSGKAVAIYFPNSLYRHYRQLRIQQNMTPDQQIDVVSVEI